MNRLLVWLLSGLALAGASGFLAATAIGVGTQAPQRTVTIDVATGATGPQGPPGSPGAESCPDGYTFGAVVFNAPGGHQQQIATCLKD